MLGEELGQLLVMVGQFLLQLASARLGPTAQRLVGEVLELVRAIVDPGAQLATERQMLAQGVQLTAALGRRRIEHDGGELGDRARIHTVVLGEPALGLGEAPHVERIEQADFETLRLQRIDDVALISRRGLQAHPPTWRASSQAASAANPGLSWENRTTSSRSR